MSTPSANPATMTVLIQPENFEPSYSIPQFCVVEGISETLYYELRKLHATPKELRYPNSSVIRITHGERLKWQAMMLDPPPELADKIRRIAARIQARAQAAAVKAVASPNHVSNTRRGKHAGLPPEHIANRRRAAKTASKRKAK